MAAGLAWTLNLDADRELAVGRGYTPTKRASEAMGPMVSLLATSLLGPDDLPIEPSSPAFSARGRIGRAFCPTPRALAILKRAGAEPEPHPAFDVLRRVNSRAFASSLGPTLPSAAFATDLDTALGLVERPSELGDTWRVKRAFGMIGRGQRVMKAGAVSAADHAFLAAGIAAGGLQIEPNVAIEREYGIHAMLSGDGTCKLGGLVGQKCDPRGAWLASERLTLSTASDQALFDTLANEASRVGNALFAAGYFGPFGVDAYTYRNADGALRLQPRSEINARYSMGFAIGFGGS